MRVNNRLQMGGTAAAVAEKRQAHLPLLLHPHPRRALFLGPATGITLGAAGVYPGLVSSGVELVPEIRAMMRYFEPENGGSFPRQGVDVTVADARRFARTTTNRYDVIVADLFHPAQDGAGFLYTREHFQSLKERLEPDGIFCQWLPLHQLDLANLQLITRTFLETFPAARAYLLHFNVDIPVLGLVGTTSQAGQRVEVALLDQRLQEPQLVPHLRSVGLDRSLNLLGCFLAGPEELRQLAGAGRVATDDWPGVLFGAPKFASRRQAPPPHQLLLELTARSRSAVDRAPAELLAPPWNQSIYGTNLSAFMQARDLYLRGLAQEASGELPAAIDSYLASAGRSVHFVPSYSRCIAVLQVWQQTDRAAAQRLFRRLEEAQPNQPLARRMFGEQLGGPP